MVSGVTRRLIVIATTIMFIYGSEIRVKVSRQLQAAALSEQRNDLASVIGLQVRQSWLDVQTTRKRIDVTQSAIAQAEENVRVVRDRYVNGLAPYTEVLDAETLRVNSETNNANAVYDAVFAGLRLKHAIGAL
jgi:outer membrane protein TolC